MKLTRQQFIRMLVLQRVYEESVKESVHAQVVMDGGPITPSAVGTKAKLLHIVSQITEFHNEHHDGCPNGAMCATYNIIDAAIMLHVMYPFEIGAYKKASDKDALCILNAIPQWKNWLSITGSRPL